MEDKIYIVTLHKHEDLEQFYSEMKSDNFHLVLKRPMSRNTHYKMNEEQAEKLRQDSRVWDVQLTPEELGMSMDRNTINYSEYIISSENFWKGDTQGAATVAPTDRQWGHVHCAGDPAQRGKNQFGLINQGGTYEQVIDTIEVFNDGKHVDVVICDDPVSSDCSEWFSPTTGLSRFVEYDWYGQLNTLVGSIDDDSQSIPSAPYSNYFSNATNTESHGTHVAGTVAGQHYGWAREANIYSLQVLSNSANTGTPVPDLLIFDYLRAFHRNKAINPDTGIKNPTITNHSWGFSYSFSDILEKYPFDLSDITEINYRGTVYNSGNPNPSGWNFAGLETDFGISSTKMKINSNYAALNADIEDAISEGVVVVAAAGNNNFHCVYDGDPDYYNTVTILNFGTIYYNRGSSPASSPNVISVGSLSNNSDFRRSNFSNFGPSITVFAPGNNIISSYDSSGIADTKYGGAPNYYYPIQGTSMASPQVTGVLACLSTGKERFTQSSAKKYLNDHSIYNDMSFDVNSAPSQYYSVYVDYFATIATNNSSFVLGGSDQNGSVLGNNPTITANVGDEINFGMPNGGSYCTFTGVTTPLPAATFPITVTAPTFSYYTLSGFHYPGVLNSGNNISVTVRVGDTLEFNLSNVAASHPFFIRDASGTTNVSTPAATGQGSTGNATVTWTPNTAGTYSYICGNHSSMKGTITVIPVSPDGYYVNVGDRILDGTQGSAVNPTINIEYGDGIDLQLTVDLSSHPVYIRDSNNNNVANVYGQGSTGVGAGLGWADTDCPAVGTYKYVCDNHSIMSGDIVVHPVGTYYNHPFYIKTVQGSGTGNQVSGVTNQGALKGNVRWIPNTSGTFYYQCGVNSSMYGEIIINPSSGGTFSDDSCQKGSPNLYLHAKNPRQNVEGMIIEQVGDRSTGLTYPRAATFNRPAPTALPKTLTLNVTNSSASSYVFNGSDRATTHVDAANATININSNDTLELSFNISGSHPFHIKTSATTGTGDNVTTGTITNNGQQSLNLTWDTNGVTPGTYYYICRFHGGMSGQIIVS